MTDRDTFAAAALTGLLAQGDDGSFSEESYARAAYRWADAMLNVRDSRTADTTNRDAAPAAKADNADDRTDKAAPSQRRDCTGDISEAQIDALECVVEDGRIVGAQGEIASLRNVVRCPHVRGTVTQHCSLNFTLTDEEREAVKLAADFLEDEFYGCSDSRAAVSVATLRKLLERLK